MYVTISYLSVINCVIREIFFRLTIAILLGNNKQYIINIEISHSINYFVKVSEEQ